MVILNVGDLEIQFPFMPYDVQKDLMKKVVHCASERVNGLLESPTGTGKTLSLLCAAIAWQKEQIRLHRQSVARNLKSVVMKDGLPTGMEGCQFSVPKIIYASRTHTQLSQAARELKRSAYSSAKAVVLGSRDVMCIHDTVQHLDSSSAKIMACQIHTKNKTCHYYNNVQKKKDEMTNHIIDKPVMDIEDLVTTGRRNKCCPFYMSREVVKEAQVIFLPYNYLLDPKLKSMHGVDLKNSVIILDEGHNIAKTCEEAVSFEIKSSTVAKCISEITKAMNELNTVTQMVGASSSSFIQDLDMGSLVSLKQSFLSLEVALDGFQVSTSVIPANDVLCAIFQNGFPPSSFAGVISCLDSVTSFLTYSRSDATGCDTFSSVLRILSSQTVFRNPASFSDSYKVMLTEERKSTFTSFSKPGKNTPKTFSFWCFNPAVGLEMMMHFQPRCVILASGTLSPLPFLEAELRIPFPVKLSNPHIISDSQLYASVVKVGPMPKCTKLSSVYANRSNSDYLTALGEVVISTCQVVPKGVLVFFPSYAFLESCATAWKNTEIIRRIENYKPVFVEPKGKHDFSVIIEKYYNAVSTGNGACLMAVCRGKVSEGIDFANDNGRAVIITGIPYAPMQDQKVIAKKAYLDSKPSGISGSNWYQMEAVRALNQAVGRIIRHAQDYGAVLLCDERFEYPVVLNNLSPWLEKRLKRNAQFNEIMNDLCKFFRTPSKGYKGPAPSKYPAPKPTPSITARPSKPKVFEPSPPQSQDIEMDCDISNMYNAPVHDREASSSSEIDLFSKMSAVKTKPAADFIKDYKAETSRDVLGSRNHQRPGIHKRSLSPSNTKFMKSRTKRFRMEVPKFQPYNQEVATSSNINLTNDSGMEIDNDE